MVSVLTSMTQVFEFSAQIKIPTKFASVNHHQPSNSHRVLKSPSICHYLQTWLFLGSQTTS